MAEYKYECAKVRIRDGIERYLWVQTVTGGMVAVGSFAGPAPEGDQASGPVRQSLDPVVEVGQQQLRITRRLGQDLTIKIKAAVKGALGHRSELLTRFGIKPRERDDAYPRAEIPHRFSSSPCR